MAAVDLVLESKIAETIEAHIPEDIVTDSFIAELDEFLDILKFLIREGVVARIGVANGYEVRFKYHRKHYLL